MGDHFDPTPAEQREQDSKATAALEQEEWERDPERTTLPKRTYRPDPKPRKRHRATKREWEDMRRAFRGVKCRACGERPFESLHHIYPRGQGGDDVIVNLFPVCGSGTTGCHGLIETHDRVTRARVRANLSDAHRWYLTAKLGHGARAWLDSAYPELEVVA